MKTILITGSTDGIGLATAEKLVKLGHSVLIHGRNAKKLDSVSNRLSGPGKRAVKSYQADLSNLDDVETLAKAVQRDHGHLDAIVNNAGVYKVPSAETRYGIDIRMVVNLLAPYLLTSRLRPLMNGEGRIINLSSAAQEPVDLDFLKGDARVGDEFSAYGQSKLANLMWSRYAALSRDSARPIYIAVNPGSFLATNMVREGFDMEGNDIGIGADVLVRACTAKEFAKANGLYFDNDRGDFGPGHPEGMSDANCSKLAAMIEEILAGLGYQL